MGCSPIKQKPILVINIPQNNIQSSASSKKEKEPEKRKSKDKSNYENVDTEPIKKGNFST